MLKRMMLIAALMGGVSTAANAQIVQNGGFEDPVINDPCCNTVPPGSLTNWTATPNVNVVNGTYASTNGNLAFEGNQYVDLVGQGGTGSISQLLTLDVGQTYTLSFAYSHNLFSGPLIPPASAEILLNGVLFAIVTHSTGTNANLDWQIFSQDFVATSASTTLTFHNLTGGTNEGIFVDAVGIGAVPEPATWAMMLLGFGGIGMAMRRSKRPARLALAH